MKCGFYPLNYINWKSGDSGGKEEPSRSLVFKYSINGRLFSAGYILRPERILQILWSGLMNNMDH